MSRDDSCRKHHCSSWDSEENCIRNFAFFNTECTWGPKALTRRIGPSSVLLDLRIGPHRVHTDTYVKGECSLANEVTGLVAHGQHEEHVDGDECGCEEQRLGPRCGPDRIMASERCFGLQ